MKKIWLVLFCLVVSAPAYAQEKPMPRTIVALYDSREASPRLTFTHRFLEMPANHLGFDFHYYDINAPLPAMTDDMLGIVIWFSPGSSVPDAKTYLDWLEAAIAQGKRLVILENAGIGDKQREQDAIMQQYNRVLSHIGIQDGNQWNAVTYRTRVDFIDEAVAGFERQIGPVLPPFGDTHVIPGRAVSHLKMRASTKEEEEAVDLITTSPRGGYVSEGYAIFHVVENDESKISQWFINPFVFLRKTLRDELSPIPDITTYNGRRIFYSHIDGDGWNNLSELPEHREHPVIAADIIRKDILEPYKDFAFSVGLIISDVDMDCYGIKDSERVARAIYALPNVEPSSHTHSHPLFWRYFANYTPEKEAPILNRYPTRPKQKSSLVESFKGSTSPEQWKQSAGHDHGPVVADTTPRGKNEDDEEARFNQFDHKQYETPRSYACTPYNLDQEISGSIARVNELSPPNKKARLIQWSGDTSPYVEALKRTREGGFYNINGGDSRFDNEYPSYSSVAPIGLRVGDERQIYSSNSNENTYTNLWTGRFFGFRYLQTTVTNTEKPMRVSPFNIYFHMYSGQKPASLLAVKENFEFARTQQVIPITASDYTAIANSFYAAQLYKLTDNSWKIANHGDLETIRFEGADDKSVDFNQSTGVLGQNYYAGNLYVSLNPATKESIIVLKNNAQSGVLPHEEMPYLIESRWPIKDLHLGKSLLTIQTQGYGRGDMTWKAPKSGNYLIKARKVGDEKTSLFEKTVPVNDDGVLAFSIDIMTPSEPLVVTIEKTEK